MELDQFKSKLKKLTNIDIWLEQEDFNPLEFSGGNYDDAYYAGIRDGKALLAKEILNDLD